MKDDILQRIDLAREGEELLLPEERFGGDNAKYADYVSDGYFHESELASAPSFDLIIDGITSQE